MTFPNKIHPAYNLVAGLFVIYFLFYMLLSHIEINLFQKSQDIELQLNEYLSLDKDLSNIDHVTALLSSDSHSEKYIQLTLLNSLYLRSWSVLGYGNNNISMKVKDCLSNCSYSDKNYIIGFIKGDIECVLMLKFKEGGDPSSMCLRKQEEHGNDYLYTFSQSELYEIKDSSPNQRLAILSSMIF